MAMSQYKSAHWSDYSGPLRAILDEYARAIRDLEIVVRPISIGRYRAATAPDDKEYPNIANDHAVRAKKLENDMEQAYHRALADLFKGTDPIYMLKMREVYRHLSNCADRGDEAANIILSIVMKST